MINQYNLLYSLVLCSRTPFLIASIREFLAWVIIGRVDGDLFKVAVEDGDTDRAQGLEMQDGDCTKEKKDCRVENLGDFKLEDLGCDGVKCLFDCATEDLCDWVTEGLNDCASKHLDNVVTELLDWENEFLGDGIKDLDVCGHEDIDESGTEFCGVDDLGNCVLGYLGGGIQ